MASVWGRPGGPTQIPGSCAHTEPLEMVVAGGDLKTDALRTDGAVGAALGTIRFGSEGYFSRHWMDGPPTSRS